MDAAVELRFTSKFADVEPLLTLPHGGRTRMRASINPSIFSSTSEMRVFSIGA
jgi:spore photoproduct lyase